MNFGGTWDEYNNKMVSLEEEENVMMLERESGV
jgi:hypothetical protein